MLDQLHDSMYEEHETAGKIITVAGATVQPAEYEMFCKRCHVMDDNHPADTDCPVGQLEHKLHAIQSQEK